MPRLPQPGEDMGTWGHVLNDFLGVAHYSNGTLKQSNVIASAEQTAHKGAANGYASLDAVGKIPTAQLGGTGATSTTFLRGDRTWAKIHGLAQVYNVKDYGAMGDGTADDTAAIQAAIDAASEGGIVFVPSGIYTISPSAGGLNLASGQSLQGVGYESVLKVQANANATNNLLKIESKQNITISNLRLDGNKSSQSDQTHYGLYIAGSTNCSIQSVWAENFTGVGIHVYNSDGIMLHDCFSYSNDYHGFEFEQARLCHVSNSRGHNNVLHGILVSPGEVGGSGSKGNSFTGCSFDHNGNYGIAMNAANGDVSAFLNEGNMFSGCNVTDNAFYGVNIYKQDKQIFNNLYVARNGYFGIYLYQSAHNTFSNVYLHNNSQANAGGYDEVLLEGASSGHASAFNTFTGGTILIDGPTKARWAIAEGSTGDGPNTFDITVPLAGTQAGKTNLQHTGSNYSHVDLLASQSIGGLKTFSNGLAVSANATLPGSHMGLDAPFGEAAFRMFSDVGNLQFVAPHGNADWYIGGNNVLSVLGSHATLHGNQLREVADPTDSQDAATKKYADDNKVAKTGADDIQVTNASKGLILKDRTTNTNYRLYINNGSLSIESV